MFVKMLNKKVVQIIISLLNVLVLVYNYYYVISKSSDTRTGYWSLNFFLMMLNTDAVCFLKKLLIKNEFLKNFGAYSFNIYLIHPTIILVYKNMLSIGTKDEEMLIIIMLSYFFGYVVFVIIEKPLMSIANKICKKYIDRL